jgi:hypothetical protein
VLDAMTAPGQVRVEDRPEPQIIEPMDERRAIKVLLAQTLPPARPSAGGAADVSRTGGSA